MYIFSINLTTLIVVFFVQLSFFIKNICFYIACIYTNPCNSVTEHR
ncbi:hypothetical protein PLIP_a0667 [Pseudoalteromonas lipolytica LMEB 39]|nr:hypothetical protein [Pseudoalteromonas lipolytica LMEB 39]